MESFSKKRSNEEIQDQDQDPEQDPERATKKPKLDDNSQGSVCTYFLDS